MSLFERVLCFLEISVQNETSFGPVLDQFWRYFLSSFWTRFLRGFWRTVLWQRRSSLETLPGGAQKEVKNLSKSRYFRWPGPHVPWGYARVWEEFDRFLEIWPMKMMVFGEVLSRSWPEGSRRPPNQRLISRKDNTKEDQEAPTPQNLLKTSPKTRYFDEIQGSGTESQDLDHQIWISELKKEIFDDILDISWIRTGQKALRPCGASSCLASKGGKTSQNL